MVMSYVNGRVLGRVGQWLILGHIESRADAHIRRELEGGWELEVGRELGWRGT